LTCNFLNGLTGINFKKSEVNIIFTGLKAEQDDMIR